MLLSAGYSRCENDPSKTILLGATRQNFLSLLGKLTYLVKCCPNIAYAVARLSCRPAKCTQKDWTALLRVLAYLRETVDFGITFSKNDTDMNLLSTISYKHPHRLQVTHRVLYITWRPRQRYVLLLFVSTN